MVAGQREQILPKRIVGKLVKWEGKSGLIEPFQEIDHPAAALREGCQVLLAQEDIDGLSLEPDCHVSFYVYADKRGLGALRCKPALGALYTKVPFGVIKEVVPIGKASTRNAVPRKAGAGSSKYSNSGAATKGKKPSSWGTGAAAATASGGAWGADAGGWAGGAGGWGKGFPPAAAAAMGMGMAMKGFPPPAATMSKGCWGGGFGGFGCAGGWEAPAAKKEWVGGPQLPRTRISEEPFSGSVVEWKGKMGWIQPDEPIDHPKAKAHKGHLYLHKKDVLELDSLEVGQQVCFHIYEDSSGLGAEECTAL